MVDNLVGHLLFETPNNELTNLLDVSMSNPVLETHSGFQKKLKQLHNTGHYSTATLLNMPNYERLFLLFEFFESNARKIIPQKLLELLRSFEENIKPLTPQELGEVFKEMHAECILTLVRFIFLLKKLLDFHVTVIGGITRDQLIFNTVVKLKKTFKVSAHNFFYFLIGYIDDSTYYLALTQHIPHLDSTFLRMVSSRGLLKLPPPARMPSSMESIRSITETDSSTDSTLSTSTVSSPNTRLEQQRPRIPLNRRPTITTSRASSINLISFSSTSSTHSPNRPHSIRTRSSDPSDPFDDGHVSPTPTTSPRTASFASSYHSHGPTNLYDRSGTVSIAPSLSIASRGSSPSHSSTTSYQPLKPRSPSSTPTYQPLKPPPRRVIQRNPRIKTPISKPPKFRRRRLAERFASIFMRGKEMKGHGKRDAKGKQGYGTRRRRYK